MAKDDEKKTTPAGILIAVAGFIGLGIGFLFGTNNPNVLALDRAYRARNKRR